MAKVRPLIISTIDWQSFIHFCKDAIGESPTRGLDKNEIQLDSATALVGSIDMCNEPRDAIDCVNPAWKQAFFGFIGEARPKAISGIALNAPLNIIQRQHKEEIYRVFVFSGTLMEWYNAALMCFNRTQKDLEILEIFYEIISIFSKIGFKTMWDNHKRVQMKSGYKVFV